MTSTRHKLGELIAQYSERCGNRNVRHSDISGVNRDKEFFPSKLVGENISNYKVVPFGYFACNLMHVGRDAVLPIAYNNSEHDVFVSPAYTVFSIKEDVLLEPRYLEMWFKSNERDRYFWMHTDSSIRDGMTFDDMCDIEIDLPPIEIQKKYVDVYNAMIANQTCYERGLEDLKLTCEGYIEDLRRKMPSEKIGKYITQKNNRNSDKSNDFIVGLSTKKEFREAQSRVNRNELGNYKIIESNEFAFVPTTDTWKVLAFALNKFGKPAVVSPIYEVFKVDESVLVPEYLSMWLSRKEFDRYARYHSWGSARENFSFEDMSNVMIPIPDISIQKSIANVYSAFNIRKTINDEMKNAIKDICPILIKGSLEEANK